MKARTLRKGSKEIDNIIISNYGVMTAKEIISIFKIDIPSDYIIGRVRQLRRHGIDIPTPKPKFNAPFNTEISKYDNILIEHYNSKNIEDIIKEFNIPLSADTLTRRTYLLRKKFKMEFDLKLRENKYNIFDNSLEAYYWLGFLFADGHFEDNQYISLALALTDINHLEKFKKFTKSDNKISIHPRTSGYSSKESAYCKFVICDTNTVGKLCNKFKISSRKTYEPPILQTNDMIDDQFIALLIGYIDGDGCIHKNTYGTPVIMLSAHVNWFKNFEFIECKISNILNTKFKNKLTKIKKVGMVKLEFGKTKVVNFLKLFAVKNKLPILDRKWDKIELDKYHPRLKEIDIRPTI